MFAVCQIMFKKKPFKLLHNLLKIPPNSQHQISSGFSRNLSRSCLAKLSNDFLYGQRKHLSPKNRIPPRNLPKLRTLTLFQNIKIFIFESLGNVCLVRCLKPLRPLRLISFFYRKDRRVKDAKFSQRKSKYIAKKHFLS